jgi:hypothetical protein
MTICQVIKMLVERLAEKGMAEDEISSCITTLQDIFADQHVKSCQDLNLQMETCGWQGFELDEQTFEMASSALTI